MGLERAGWECAWHAEIADAPRAILGRWADTPLYGDVMALDGRALVAAHGPVDLITGGSPCQDLSVAGKRAGLGGARSSLFFQQMRLWDETGADLCLWENVDGARSSNAGKDFGAVLRAFVGAAIAVPSDGWRGAGVAAGPTGVAAWRVLDAQHFGVPQRRRRVFVLGTRAGRVDPAEVLSLSEGVRGDSPTRREAREGITCDASRGTTVPIQNAAYSRSGINATPTADASGSLRIRHPSLGIGADGDPMFTLDATLPHAVVAFDWQNSASMGMECRSESEDSLRANAVPAVVAFDTTQITSRLNRSNPKAGDPCHPLAAGAHAPAICLTGDVTHALTHEGHDASEDGTGRGTPIVANTVTAREAKGWNPARDVGNGTVSHGIPRRLTPRECERLMGWQDDHTLVPDAKGKLLSDAARYKACGNGVASVVAHWIGWRLMLELTA